MLKKGLASSELAKVLKKGTDRSVHEGDTLLRGKRIALGTEWSVPFFKFKKGTRMDLRAYYQQIRKIESEINEETVVIVSRETSDGGRAGVRTEVPRTVAARMIAQETADLASTEVAAQFRSETEAKWRTSMGARPKSAPGLGKSRKEQ